ncbi:MAG: Rieske (2Fe-2S) protein [Tepidisphaeraceae bacterium]|jgi:Rieske Fe-S protein
MNLTRRQTLAVLATATLGGCAGAGVPSSGNSALGPVDVGAIEAYPADGVYAGFRDRHELFIVRAGNRIFAQSAICTHRRCALAAAEAGFVCGCHGSTFTLQGKVTRGPAVQDLPRFAIEKDARGHLLVHPERVLATGQFDEPGAFIAL